MAWRQDWVAIAFRRGADVRRRSQSFSVTAFTRSRHCLSAGSGRPPNLPPGWQRYRVVLVAIAFRRGADVRLVTNS